MKDVEIDVKSNSLEEREEIDIKLIEQKADTDNNKNVIDFRWSDEKRRRRGRLC